MRLRIVAAAALLAGFAAFLAVLALSENGPPAVAVNLTRAADCEACHSEVYAEWKSNWHAKAWFDPLVRAPEQSDNFKKKDCIPCHAPRPLFEVGLGPNQRVVERQVNRQDGVDCIACHKLPDGGFASANPDPEGPCRPKFHPGMRSVNLCAPCHNQHNTVDEWVAAPAELRGESCNHCHYPEVLRAGRDGGPPRPGRSHLLRSWRLQNLDMEALSIAIDAFRSGPVGGAAPEGGGRVRVTLTNEKTPHNVPADSRNRALDLVLTYFDAGGLPLPAADGLRDYGQEPGTYRMRFRNPYRSEIGTANTQIACGASAVLDAPAPPGAVRARVQLLYKLTPFTLDADAISILDREVILP